MLCGLPVAKVAAAMGADNFIVNEWYEEFRRLVDVVWQKLDCG